MTDNRTTEQRISKPLLGFIKHQRNRGYIDAGQAQWLFNIADEIDAKHEQAIAATLGNGTLTAEQAREIIVKYIEPRFYGNWQAIANELNAELGSGTCCLHYGEDDDGYDGWYCDECGGWFQAVRRDGHLVKPKYCQECGKAVER